MPRAELATITGTVTDASSAVAAQRRITITNEQTNNATQTLTNEGGRYVVPGLRPGVYKVQAALPGFKEYVQSGVTLQVNQTARIDVALALGDTTEQVTVKAEASVLETETSSRGAVIDQRKMVELPLNGRDYNQLAMLSPGVLLPTPRFASIGFKGVFNVNGNRATQNAFVLDGVDNVSYASSYRGMNMQIVQPSVDALQEFKVQTNGYAAEFGRSSGAIINAVVKSGTNQLHGAGYEFPSQPRTGRNQLLLQQIRRGRNPARLRNQFQEPISAAPSSGTGRSSSATMKDCAIVSARFRSPPFPRPAGRTAGSRSRFPIRTTRLTTAPISYRRRPPTAMTAAATAG